MMRSLSGKVALVTGGTSGIGLATAKKLAGEGASVFIVGRRKSELDRAVAEIGGNVHGMRADVANLGELDQLYAVIAAGAGALDIVVANAALSDPQALGEVTEEAVDRQLGTNVKGVIFTVSKSLPVLRDGGAVILISSIAAFKAVPMQSVYAASKAAVRALARSWAVELKDRRIRVNVVSPGPVDTPGAAAVMDAAAKETITTLVPVGRLGTPADIANMIAFLASDAAGFVNGADFQVDGGLGQI